ncbi:hypothetical protein WJX82_001917 [Trebouxia sp. C0006]
MEGFLFKRGELVKTWRARYFVLRSGPWPVLTYYRAIETGEGPSGSWSLEGSTLHLAESTGLKKYRFIFEDAHGQRTQLAAHTAKERQDWMNAVAEATVRSGSAGASSSKGGTPVASSHKRYSSLEHTPAPVSLPGETEGSASPPEIPLLPMKADTQAAAAEASLQDTFTTPLPLPRPLRRASADIPGTTLTASSHLRKAQSHREGISRSPSGAPGTPFTPLVYKASSHQPLPRKQSIFSAIKDVILGSAQSDSTSSPRSDFPQLAGDMLPAEAIMEQFDRAQQYVLKNRGEFTAEQQNKLQGWMGAVQVSRDKGVTTAAVAAAAMFVLVVTRSNDEWSSWSEHDNMFVSPENMMSEVQRWPSRPTLEDLKECLDYCSTSWVSLYCRLGGAHLLLEALNMHRDAAQEGHAEAHEAVLASLQCMQALTSGGGGMDAAIAAPDFVQCLCSVLDPDDQDCSKLVVEMLTKLCLYSADGYCAAIQTVLGELKEIEAEHDYSKPAYKGQSDYVSIIASASTPPALPPAGLTEHTQHASQHTQQAVLPVEFCSILLAMMTWNHLDSDLCQHVITLINTALHSPDGPHKGNAKCLALRQRLVMALLDKGLMRVISDLQDLVQESLFNDLEMMKMTIKRLLAPVKHPASPSAPPPPAPAPPKRPPPPPPPGRGHPAAPAALKQRPRVDPGPRPSRKMKSFFWDKLPENRLQGTFWQDRSPPYSALHVEEVETLFQAMQRSAKRPASTARQKLAVLDLKRATAVGIRMSRLRVPWQKIPHAVIKLDSKAFQTADDVRAVLQCVPTQDEANLLQSYVRAGGKLEGLSDAELFCMDLVKTPRVEARLSTFLTRFEAQQQLAEAKGILEGHQKAHQELKGSPCMAAALQLTLAMGNFLNWGTRLGQGAGFRLRNLPKLQDTQSLDGKTSLLSYIARQLSTGHSPAALLAHEMPHVVGPALKTSVQEVTDMIDKTSVAMDLVRSELKRSTVTVKVSLTVSPCVQTGSVECEQKCGLSPKPSVSPDSSNKRAQSPSQEASLVADQQQQQQQQQTKSSRLNHDEDSRTEVLVELLSDNYQDVMSQTVREVDKELKLARQLLGQCKESFSSLVSFYGENAQAFANDAVFWSDVVAFVQKFTACQRALRKQMQEQEDMTRRKELRRTLLQGNADELLSPTSSSAADFGASLASPCVAAASVSVRLQQDASVAADVALQPASVSVSTAAPAQACANSGGNA